MNYNNITGYDIEVTL